MLWRLWLLVVPDRQTDRQTLSPIELFWTAKKEHFPYASICCKAFLESSNFLLEVALFEIWAFVTQARVGQSTAFHLLDDCWHLYSLCVCQSLSLMSNWLGDSNLLDSIAVCSYFGWLWQIQNLRLIVFTLSDVKLTPTCDISPLRNQSPTFVFNVSDVKLIGWVLLEAGLQ